MRRVVEEVSPERMVMGTDRPTEVSETEMEKIRMAVPDEEKRALVVGGNIARLLKLNQ